MVTIHYESHATSLDNERRVASGHHDVELSDVGRHQALQLGERCAAVHLDAVFCSDLQRSYRTAEIAFAGRAIPIIRDRRLREWDYGALAGRPRDEVLAALPIHLTDPFPGGESVEQAVERVGRFLRELAVQYDEKTVLMIGHRATHLGLEYWITGGALPDLLTASLTWPPRQLYVLRDAARRRLEGHS